MKTIIHSSVLFLLLFVSNNIFPQNKKGSVILSGKIIFEKDSIYPYKPYSIILEKTWPISFKQYEQQVLDTTDFSFKIKMDLDQLTYGYIIVSLFREVDSTSIEQNRSRIASEVPESFNSRKYANRIIYNQVKLVIEPGDNLNIVINYNKTDKNGQAFASFSGEGSANNNYNQVREIIEFRSDNFRLPLAKGLSNEDKRLNERLNILSESKDSLSQAYFDLLKTDILFNNLIMKYVLIRAYLNGSELPIEEKRNQARELYAFMDTLTLRSEYVNSTEFRRFLNSYLEYIDRIVSGKDNQISASEKSYYMANAFFGKDVLKAFLFERLKMRMEVPHLSTYPYIPTYYEDFIHQFPNTPESQKLTQIYNKHFPVTLGQMAPELELIDSHGNTRYLSDLRGKVVIISTNFRSIDIRADRRMKSEIEALRKKYSKNELVLIAINDRLLGRQKYYWSSFDYYAKDDLKNKNLNSYIFRHSGPFCFIIGKNGIIKGYSTSLNFRDNIILKLNSENYTAFTRLNNFAQHHSRGIIVVLSILFSMILILFLITKLRQKKQNLVKKQLYSELKAIRSQLNPHFLFNSLNSIQNFITKCDTETANMHLSKFSILMRKVIELSEKESTTLKEEIDFNTAYIELEQLRYGFKFNFEIDKTIDIYNTEIPSMIIQPFVENAIVHAMAENGEKGELCISVKDTGKNEIYVEIKDNGKGFLVETSKGFGLKSSRERIDLLNSQYKDKIELQIESSTNGEIDKGTTIKLVLPKKY